MPLCLCLSWHGAEPNVSGRSIISAGPLRNTRPISAWSGQRPTGVNIEIRTDYEGASDESGDGRTDKRRVCISTDTQALVSSEYIRILAGRFAWLGCHPPSPNRKLGWIHFLAVKPGLGRQAGARTRETNQFTLSLTPPKLEGTPMSTSHFKSVGVWAEGPEVQVSRAPGQRKGGGPYPWGPGCFSTVRKLPVV
jgi:hypothetical protein